MGSNCYSAHITTTEKQQQDTPKVLQSVIQSTVHKCLNGALKAHGLSSKDNSQGSLLSSSNSPDKSDVTCGYCGKTGHTKSKCFKNKRNAKIIIKIIIKTIIIIAPTIPPPPLHQIPIGPRFLLQVILQQQHKNRMVKNISGAQCASAGSSIGPRVIIPGRNGRTHLTILITVPVAVWQNFVLPWLMMMTQLVFVLILGVYIH